MRDIAYRSGMDAMGHPVPGFRRQAAYRAFKDMLPDATNDEAMTAVDRFANALERDEPYRIVGIEHLRGDAVRLDLTGRIRMMAELLAAPMDDQTPGRTDPDLDVYIKRERVAASSSVASMGYSPRTCTLEVRFLPQEGNPAYPGGTIYRYGGVPRSTWERLRAASSKGRALQDLVKAPGYAYERVR